MGQRLHEDSLQQTLFLLTDGQSWSFVFVTEYRAMKTARIVRVE